MTRPIRLLLVVNLVTMAAAVAWMAVSYGGRVERVHVVDVPARYDIARAAWTSRDDSDTPPPEGEDATNPESAEQEHIHPLHDLARRAFTQEQVDEAIHFIQQAIAALPEDPALRNDLGIYYLAKKQPGDAAREFEQAIALAPEYPRSFYNLGTLRLREDRPDEAARLLQKAIEKNPYYANAHYNLGRAYSEAGNTRDAILEYTRVTEIDRGPTSTRAYVNIGVLQMRSRRWHDALAAFTSALRRQPDHVGARYNKAFVLKRLDLDDQAASEYQKILQIAPTHVASRVNLAAIYMRQERWDAAIDELTRAMEHDPENPRALYNIGLCHLRRDEFEAAAAAFERATVRDPRYAEAYSNLGTSLRRMERHEDAARAYRRAVALAPDHAEYAYNLALVLGDCDSVTAAIESYRTALRLRPNYYKARYNLALLLYRGERYAEAAGEFEKAVGLWPTSFEARYNLGLAHLKLRRYAEAEQDFRSALAHDETVQAYHYLGTAQRKQNALGAAARSFEQALRLDPRYIRSVEALGEVYALLGEHDKAVHKLKQVQALQDDDPTAYNTGLAFYQAGDFVNAARYFEVALDGPPALRSKSHNMLGVTEARLGRPALAIDHYRKALDVDPTNERARKNLESAQLQDN